MIISKMPIIKFYPLISNFLGVALRPVEYCRGLLKGNIDIFGAGQMLFEQLESTELNFKSSSNGQYRYNVCRVLVGSL